jgi:hypothetical protein
LGSRACTFALHYDDAADLDLDLYLRSFGQGVCDVLQISCHIIDRKTNENPVEALVKDLFCVTGQDNINATSCDSGAEPSLYLYDLLIKCLQWTKIINNFRHDFVRIYYVVF